MKFHTLFIVVLAAVVFSACNKDQAPEDSYFYASIDGPSWNGEVRITGEMDDLVGQAVISPSGDPDVPDVLSITYNED